MKFTITGKVIGGSRTGRKMGFPTANLRLGADEGLANGVYRARVEVAGRVLDGIANLGRKPTFGSTERLLEVHIFDFAADIYGEEITVSLLEFIRPEQKFDSAETLRQQIVKDISTIKNMK